MRRGKKADRFIPFLKKLLQGIKRKSSWAADCESICCAQTCFRSYAMKIANDVFDFFIAKATFKGRHDVRAWREDH